MIVGEEGVVVGSFSGKSLLPTRLDLFRRRDFPFFEPPLDIPKRLDGAALRPQPQAVQVVIADRLETVWRSEPFVELLMTRGDERVFAFALAAEESEILDLRSEHGAFVDDGVIDARNVMGGRDRTQGKSNGGGGRKRLGTVLPYRQNRRPRTGPPVCSPDGACNGYGVSAICICRR